MDVKRITDVYPADFLWTPDWRLDDETWLEWYHDMSRVLEAGPPRRSVNVAYDDEVEFEAVRWLHEHADGGDDRPFALTVSFISPHDPYLPPPRWWERYHGVEIDPPRVADIPLEERDPHGRRHWFLTGRHRAAVGESDVLHMRRACYALTSYIDAKVGRLLETLGEVGAADDTLVVFTSDHGDSLGERGLFFKMSFFEWSVRVPLIVYAPFAFGPRRVRTIRRRGRSSTRPVFVRRREDHRNHPAGTGVRAGDDVHGARPRLSGERRGDRAERAARLQQRGDAASSPRGPSCPG